jgi:hypothetical protein
VTSAKQYTPEGVAGIRTYAGEPQPRLWSSGTRDTSNQAIGVESLAKSDLKLASDPKNF